MLGSTISHYRILEALGTGGMGTVYLAEDLRLHRKVALKFLTDGSTRDGHAQERLIREAQAASALDHTNIETVYEIGDWEGRPFIAMVYCRGETLKQRIERGPLSIAEVVSYSCQMAAGLAAAHAAGIIHRDLKPANVIITPEGQVKILDFGLARHVTTGDSETFTQMTVVGTTLGTVAYMAPEQARGQLVDERADVWALGVVIYEMLSGKKPFTGETATAMLLALATDEPVPLGETRPDTPPDLQVVVRRALVKDPKQRTITADEIARVLAPVQQKHAATPAGWRTGRIGKALIATSVVATLSLLGIAGWQVRRSREVRWATQVAAPEARRLMEEEKYFEAFEMMRSAHASAPKESVLTTAWAEISRPLSVATTPEGADIAIARYGQGTPSWTSIGVSPLSNVAVPRGPLRLRVQKAGFATVEDVSQALSNSATEHSFVLATAGRVPEGMVRAGGMPSGTRLYLLPGADPIPIEFNSFWIDRFEVTNHQFKAFVDAGGYRRREFWKHPFVKGTQTLSWEEAMELFRDSTGRPGPATWQAGSYPHEQDGVPVRGVSWYEAAAYAAFAGKQLPTMAHWVTVAGSSFFTSILPAANFGGSGPLAGTNGGVLHRFGAMNLAGNVKEWVANSAGADLRYTLGGAWDEPSYMAIEPDARPALERAPNFGFRCARFDAGDKSPDLLGGTIERPLRDYEAETPVDDQVFAAYRRFFTYEPGDVKAVSLGREDAPDWQIETVAYAAAYAGEQVHARVFIPKNVSPPFQAVIYVTGAGQFALRRSTNETNLTQFAHVVRSGRLVIFPILKGAFERGSSQFLPETSKNGILWRDYSVAWHKDLARTIDYLHTRSDVAHDRIAYLGQSRGAAIAPITLALEDRIKAAVLMIPGLYLARPAPEADVFNFAPRVRQPILMLSGRYDFIFPEKRSQLPFFARLGTPDSQKRRVAFDSGHNLPPNEMIRETLDWFDKYLGTVQR